MIPKQLPAKLKTDIPFWIIVVLALLAIPRVFIHDLHLLPLDSSIYRLLALGPLVGWVLLATLRNNKRPVYDFIILGLVFGLLLAITHQLTWEASWGDNPPQLHGNLAGQLDPTIEGLLLRGAAVISSLVTGVVFGCIVALIAWVTTTMRRVIS